MDIISKILSYFFAFVVIFTTGNAIYSIFVTQDNISTADGLLIFCLLMIMTMGIYYIGNDFRVKKEKKTEKMYRDDEVLDEELLKP